MLLCPVVALLALFLLGSLRVAAAEQSRAALQARADTCAAQLAVARERLLDRLARANAALGLTVEGITAARAAMLVPGAGAAAAAAEKALLAANAALARGQDALVAAALIRESAFRCVPDSFSRAPVRCFASWLPLRRLPTPFPDVRGRLAFRRGGAGRVRCGSGRVGTTLEIRGDAQLMRGGYRDVYVE